MNDRPFCTCNDAWRQRGREVSIHHEIQDESSDAWKRLLDLIADAAAHNVEEWAPRTLMPPEEWFSLATLPAQISTLKSVRKLTLYGSSLVRVPPEIGEMSALEDFDPYTSYRLHWLPFEITRCSNLVRSRISTRALYGNFKHRNPFPNLTLRSDFLAAIRPSSCSVCGTPFKDNYIVRWISLKVATNVMPLLVFACSSNCLDTLPDPPVNYVSKPHRGGRSIEQPARGMR